MCSTVRSESGGVSPRVKSTTGAARARPERLEATVIAGVDCEATVHSRRSLEEAIEICSAISRDFTVDNLWKSQLSRRHR